MYELQHQRFLGRCAFVDQRVISEVSKYISFFLRATYFNMALKVKALQSLAQRRTRLIH